MAVLWTFTFSSDGDEDCIQAVMNTSDCLNNLVTIIHESKDTNIVIPGLVTVGNFVTCNAHQVQEVINAGSLDIAEYLLKVKHKTSVWKLAKLCQTFSSGTQAQVDELINQNKVIVLLVEYTAMDDWKLGQEQFGPLQTFHP